MTITPATIGFILILLSLALQSVFLFRKKSPVTVVTLLNGLAAALLITEIIVRSIQVQYIALLGTYDSLIFYSAVMLILLVIYDRQKRHIQAAPLRYGATVIALALLALASSPIVDSIARPPIPALRSGWLIIHVALSFIGEAFFAFSFVTAVLSLTSKFEERRLSYDRLTYTGIVLGYPIFTLGALIFGAVWAENAWGRWWSWDPKETWALITWLVYTVFLHLRFVKKSSGRVLALFSVIGFLCTLFTFFGVNYLLSGLHSYG